MGLIRLSSGSADLEVLLITGHVMSLSPFDPLLPRVYPPQKWTLRGGSSNNFIHICVHHEHIGFCLLNL